MQARAYIGSALLGLCLTVTTRVEAYNPKTHQRIVEAAIEAMVEAQKSPRPADVASEEWSRYVEALITSVANLTLLQSGLLPAFANSDLPAPPDSVNPRTNGNQPEICGYHSEDLDTKDLNLLNANTIQIRSFTFYPSINTAPCAYLTLSLPGLNPGDPPRPRTGGALGPVLGWQAASPDLRYKDTILWSRPTNAGVASLVTELVTRGVEIVGGALLVPFVCLGELVFSGKSCVQDSFDLATRADPVTYVAGLLPGVGSISGEDFVGVWHFIDTGATVNRYNDVRGMFYENGGPSYPGAVDVAIMVGADLSGLSLNASSEGIDRYGQYDRVQRAPTQWQAHTLGHTEFSPVSNLARNGWDAFLARPTSAVYLADALHAIGDAAAPQHVVGTTGWGHRPFEDAVNNLRSSLLPESSSNPSFPLRARVLRVGFDAWKAFNADPDIQRFVWREAQATRALALQDNDWVYQDGASVEYAAGSRNAPTRRYEEHPNQLSPYVELGVGYTIAFLAKAGQLAKDAGPSPDSFCPIGTHFTGEGSGCSAGPAPPPPDPLPGDFSELSCRRVGESCLSTVECCGGTCFGGRCQSLTCKDVGVGCQTSSDCCSLNCSDVCQAAVK